MQIKPQLIITLFDLYLDECRYVLRHRPATLRTMQESFRHFKAVLPEVIYASDVTPEIITLFFKRLQTRERIVGKAQKRIGIKDSTIKTYGTRFKTFFKWLFNKGYIAANPFDKLELPQPEFTDHRALKKEEIRRMMGAVAQHSHTPFLLKRDMAMIGIMTFCGLRRSELLQLEVRDVDLYNSFLTVRGETSKSKRTRKVPINIHLRLYLVEYLEERKKRSCKCPYLLVSNNADKPFTSHGLKHWVERWQELSGVKFHVHRFRHTFATNLAMQDVGVVKIQKLMGHTDIKMTSAYLRSVSTEQMREDVNKLSFENLN